MNQLLVAGEVQIAGGDQVTVNEQQKTSYHITCNKEREVAEMCYLTLNGGKKSVGMHATLHLDYISDQSFIVKPSETK